ncbi:MAG: hypothetical protein IJH86_02580 [Clostridia bacterium]|nr:hypothetical protein [Clostridia bacterium]
MKKLISLLLAALMLIVAVPTLAEELPAEEIVSVEEIIPVEAVQPETEPEVVALSEAPEPEAAPAVEPEAAPAIEPEAAPEAEEAASDADAEPEQAEAADEAEFVDDIIACEALDESVAEEAVLDLDEIAAEGLSIEGDSEDAAGDDPLLFAAMEGSLTGEGIDPVFWSYLIGEFDADGDGALSQAEIDSVTTITLSEYDEATEQYVGFGVADLTGIERFRNLNYLSLENNAVTQLNVSGNTNLINLQCDGNPLETLTLGTLPKLSYLSCNHANLTALDMSGCTRLSALDCNDNRLSALNVSRNTELEFLCSDGNQLTALNVKNNGALYKLTCSNNLLTTLDISGLSELQHVSCRGNQLTSLKADNCEWMYTIDCRGNQLTLEDYFIDKDSPHGYSVDVMNGTAMEPDENGNTLISLSSTAMQKGVPVLTLQILVNEDGTVLTGKGWNLTATDLRLQPEPDYSPIEHNYTGFYYIDKCWKRFELMRVHITPEGSFSAVFSTFRIGNPDNRRYGEYEVHGKVVPDADGNFAATMYSTEDGWLFNPGRERRIDRFNLVFSADGTQVRSARDDLAFGIATDASPNFPYGDIVKTYKGWYYINTGDLGADNNHGLITVSRFPHMISESRSSRSESDHTQTCTATVMPRKVLRDRAPSCRSA